MHSFKELSELFKDKFAVNHFPASPSTLYEPAEYFLTSSGKRIRPVMCLMANELFDEINPDAYHVAAAIELFHNFTLIHDDIMDKAPLRRGRQTVHAKYGEPTALLAGDVMLVVAYDYLNKIRRDYLGNILHLFNRTAREVCEGQQIDMDFEKTPQVVLPEYIKMIELKTSVLLAASLQLGSILGGAGKGNQQHMYEFGRNLGIGFQVQDDFLDAFGDPEKFGKQQGGDILANKKTFLMIKALEVANSSQQEEMKQLMSESSPDKVQRTLKIFKDCGVDEWAMELKEKYISTAFQHLEDIAVLSSRQRAIEKACHVPCSTGTLDAMCNLCYLLFLCGELVLPHRNSRYHRLHIEVSIDHSSFFPNLTYKTKTNMASSLLRKKSIDKILADAEAGLLDGHGHLNKVLGVRDLTFMGIAAVIGAGIFSSIGKACFDGGPGVIFLYIFTAVACGFAALCYAEFASTVPVSGSAYTYSYVAFGEIFAWIIGWDLLMEYAIGNIAVAISWSDYFTGLLDKAGLHIYPWLTMDYTTAHAAFNEASAAVSGGQVLQSLDPMILYRYEAWTQSPNVLGLHLIMDLPALLIVALITAVVFVGIKESRNASNIMVIIKLAVIFLIIVLGAYYVNPVNWSPFTPNGFSGIMKGVSAVFFAYIGFDAISTTAEECKNPQRDLPRGMIYSLIICTILYVLLALILTGMVHYTRLNVGDPLALIFEARGLKWISGIVAVSAIIATASVLLVFQLGQPRIWMSMSRDGLLPKIFSKLHPVYHTPSFSTILTGVLVAVPALFLNLDVVLALTSIGTLFAFVLVCGGVLVLQKQQNKPVSKFKVPFINGKYIVPGMFIFAVALIAYKMPSHFSSIFSKEGFPMLIFWTVALIISAMSFMQGFSLIPVLGLTSCFYLMAQESHTNWLRFLIWLCIGLVIYFLYGRNHSKLGKETLVS